jgi:DNA-binding transcriptional LysR family regulator
MSLNLRHLRLALAVAEGGSASFAAAKLRISQPAATQAIAGLEAALGHALFDRDSKGLRPNKAGETVVLRLTRAFARLDPALAAISPRLKLTATTPQLRALISVVEAGSVTLAAARLGLAQPSVQRAIGQIESEAQRPLFERTSQGLRARRPTRDLAVAARLAFAEIDQARGDLAALSGGQGERIIIGAMPLSRAAILGPALSRWRAAHPHVPVRILDGPYDDLLRALVGGEAHILVGALRDPQPSTEITQQQLFLDRLCIVHRPGHPLADRKVTRDELASASWVIAAPGAPAHTHFTRLFGTDAAQGATETGSLILMREILLSSDALGLISERQVAPEVARGTLDVHAFRPEGTERPIGLTHRTDFLPTPAQSGLLQAIRDVAAEAYTV